MASDSENLRVTRVEQSRPLDQSQSTARMSPLLVNAFPFIPIKEHKADSSKKTQIFSLFPVLSLMDFDRKYKENLGSQPMLLPENYLKSYMGDGGFSLEACSSKAFFQDFHHLDHQFPTNASSKTLQFGVQTACLDPFDSFTYGSGMNLDVYELKPYAENVGVMENFQSNNGGGYLLHHHQRAAAADMMGLDRGRVAFNCQEIKPVNFVIPDEVCIAAENSLYKKISMSSAKNGASPAAKKTYKGRKKTHVVKGQWTIEEDR